MTKSELRQICRTRQKVLSESEREEKSRVIAGRFFERFDLEKINFLHIFLPIEKHGEIDTAFILERLRKDFPHLEIVAPRVDFTAMLLENVRFTATVQLVRNRWGTLEPLGSEVIESKRIDAVLVPLLCFDERGFRVGYGKGFYDKFLSECRADCLKIGLSFFPPVAEISDAQNFDVRLDCCVTPSAIYNFAK